MNLGLNELINEIKDKKIIGIGENVHGSNESWIIRTKIILELIKYRKDIVILLEENNENLSINKKEDRFIQHNSEIFNKFLKLFKNKIVGIDNHLESSIRNKWMFRDIIKEIRKYDSISKEQQPIFIFLGYDTHISKYDKSNNKKWSKDSISYEENKEVGAYLFDKFGDNYVSIGLIGKGGYTLGKEYGDWNWKKIKYENMDDIKELRGGRFYKDKKIKYIGYGPFYYDKYETRWLDYFYVIPKNTELRILKN